MASGDYVVGRDIDFQYGETQSVLPASSSQSPRVAANSAAKKKIKKKVKPKVAADLPQRPMEPASDKMNAKPSIPTAPNIPAGAKASKRIKKSSAEASPIGTTIAARPSSVTKTKKLPLNLKPTPPKQQMPAGGRKPGLVNVKHASPANAGSPTESPYNPPPPFPENNPSNTSPKLIARKAQQTGASPTKTKKAGSSKRKVAPPPAQRKAVARVSSKAEKQRKRALFEAKLDDQVSAWLKSTQEERQQMFDYWKNLDPEDRGRLTKPDKAAIFDLFHQELDGCDCAVCSQRSVSLDEQLEGLWNINEQELNRYAEALRDDKLAELGYGPGDDNAFVRSFYNESYKFDYVDIHNMVLPPDDDRHIVQTADGKRYELVPHKTSSSIPLDEEDFEGEDEEFEVGEEEREEGEVEEDEDEDEVGDLDVEDFLSTEDYQKYRAESLRKIREELPESMGLPAPLVNLSTAIMDIITEGPKAALTKEQQARARRFELKVITQLVAMTAIGSRYNDATDRDAVHNKFLNIWNKLMSIYRVHGHTEPPSQPASSSQLSGDTVKEIAQMFAQPIMESKEEEVMGKMIKMLMALGPFCDNAGVNLSDQRRIFLEILNSQLISRYPEVVSQFFTEFALDVEVNNGQNLLKMLEDLPGASPEAPSNRVQLEMANYYKQVQGESAQPFEFELEVDVQDDHVGHIGGTDGIDDRHDESDHNHGDSNHHDEEVQGHDHEGDDHHAKYSNAEVIGSELHCREDNAGSDESAGDVLYDYDSTDGSDADVELYRGDSEADYEGEYDEEAESDEEHSEENSEDYDYRGVGSYASMLNWERKDEVRRLKEASWFLRHIFTKLCEQRLLKAYREHVAKERQEMLLAELAEEEARAEAEAQRKQREKEKKKSKKLALRQQREEEAQRKALEAKKRAEKAEAAREKEAQRRQQQLEQDRAKQEAHRRKIEERMAQLALSASEIPTPKVEGSELESKSENFKTKETKDKESTKGSPAGTAAAGAAAAISAGSAANADAPSSSTSTPSKAAATNNAAAKKQSPQSTSPTSPANAKIKSKQKPGEKAKNDKSSVDFATEQQSGKSKDSTAPNSVRREGDDNHPPALTSHQKHSKPEQKKAEVKELKDFPVANHMRNARCDLQPDIANPHAAAPRSAGPASSILDSAAKMHSEPSPLMPALGSVGAGALPRSIPPPGMSLPAHIPQNLPLNDVSGLPSNLGGLPSSISRGSTGNRPLPPPGMSPVPLHIALGNKNGFGANVIGPNSHGASKKPQKFGVNSPTATNPLGTNITMGLGRAGDPSPFKSAPLTPGTTSFGNSSPMNVPHPPRPGSNVMNAPGSICSGGNGNGLPLGLGMNNMGIYRVPPQAPAASSPLAQPPRGSQPTHAPSQQQLPQPRAFPAVSNLWSPTPASSNHSGNNGWARSPWNEDRHRNTDTGATLPASISPWAKSNSQDSNSVSPGEISEAAKSSYTEVKHLGVEGFVPSQVLYHATLAKLGNHFTQNELYKACAKLPSFDCMRDDVGLITHIKFK